MGVDWPFVGFCCLLVAHEWPSGKIKGPMEIHNPL